MSAARLGQWCILIAASMAQIALTIATAWCAWSAVRLRDYAAFFFFIFLALVVAGVGLICLSKIVPT